ncbi:MAG: transposase [Cyanothece sp. SIO2G6]|nr:transposase [Cyanothece sp. SIO2G6]
MPTLRYISTFSDRNLLMSVPLERQSVSNPRAIVTLDTDPSVRETVNPGESFPSTNSNKSLPFKPQNSSEYQIVGNQGFKSGDTQFYAQVLCNKADGIGPMNLAVYWKRRDRKKDLKEPCYILTNLSNLKQTLALYRCRWGIEQMFKHMKTSGFSAGL